jgi:hypothetical protein
MSQNIKSKTSPIYKNDATFSTMFAMLLVPIAVVVGYLIYKYVLGSPLNFIDAEKIITENIPS